MQNWDVVILFRLHPECHTFNFTPRGRYWGQIQVCSAYGIISCEAIPTEGEGIERHKQLKWASMWVDLRGSHSPVLDLLRFSTAPSVGFSRGMQWRRSTTVTHTVCRDPPSFHNLPLQSYGVTTDSQSSLTNIQLHFLVSYTDLPHRYQPSMS